MKHTPAILTRSGRLFDLLNPSAEHVDMTDITFALSNVARFSGHTRTRWTVAQHLLLCYRLVQGSEHPHAGLHALMHDMAEAYVGDVSAPLKQLIPGYKEIENLVHLAIMDHFGVFTPSNEIRDFIKTIDMVAYCSERDVLMPPLPDYGHSDVKTFSAVREAYPNLIETGKRFITKNLFANAEGAGTYKSPGHLARTLEMAFVVELKKYQSEFTLA